VPSRRRTSASVEGGITMRGRPPPSAPRRICHPRKRRDHASRLSTWSERTRRGSAGAKPPGLMKRASGCARARRSGAGQRGPRERRRRGVRGGEAPRSN
jgi:hypothetical protein